MIVHNTGNFTDATAQTLHSQIGHRPLCRPFKAIAFPQHAGGPGQNSLRNKLPTISSVTRIGGKGHARRHAPTVCCEGCNSRPRMQQGRDITRMTAAGGDGRKSVGSDHVSSATPALLTGIWKSPLLGSSGGMESICNTLPINNENTGA